MRISYAAAEYQVIGESFKECKTLFVQVNMVVRNRIWYIKKSEFLQKSIIYWHSKFTNEKKENAFGMCFR